MRFTQLIPLLTLALIPGQPARAGAKAVSRNVTFQDGEPTLSGILSLPAGEGPHPAVILISGSGPQDRDGAMTMIPGYKPFAMLADHLTSVGIAVLRYDDRGVGQSTGDYLDADEADFVRDAGAAVEFLSRQEGIDPRRIGLLGQSEGALIAAMLAGEDERVAFVVSLGGPAVRGYDLLLQQTRRAAEAEGMSADEVEQVAEEQRRLFDLVIAEAWDKLEQEVRDITRKRLEALPKWKKLLLGDLDKFAAQRTAQSMFVFKTDRYQFLLKHDTSQDWAKIKVPVLAMFGNLDVQCDAEQNRKGIEQAMQRGGNARLSVHVIDDANHLFLSAKTGSMSEYRLLPKDAFAPGVLPTISDWILAITGLAPADGN